MRVVFRLLADRLLPPRATTGSLHILVPRWDAKLGDSIVSSFFFREVRRLNARVGDSNTNSVCCQVAQRVGYLFRQGNTACKPHSDGRDLPGQISGMVSIHVRPQLLIYARQPLV
ncbi:hypothetical protein D9M68_584170 [compost metagenome]